MKKWMLVFHILALLGLTGCQASKETVVERHYLGAAGGGDGLPVPPGQSDLSDGTLDGGGGGNGVDGKPLESYRTDISKLPAFIRIQQRVIQQLQGRFPKLAADLIHISEERAWYFVPTELKNLPAYRIGVSFKTDQFALQKLKEIWFNKLIFEKMSEEDQDILVLHELLMGVRLLEFTNLLDQCLARISPLRLTALTQEKYKSERRECFRANRRASEVGDSIGLGKTIRLEDYDYDSIRELTTLLITKAESLDTQELEDWMAIRKFRKY